MLRLSSLDVPTHKDTQPWLLEHIQQHPKASYPCLPLNPHRQEIRLLRLEGDKGRLRGSLVVCPLERYHEGQHGQNPIDNTRIKEPQQKNSQTAPSQPDSFEALSYTWGESLHSESIEVQNHILIPITDNLARALRRLRRPQQPRTLWIDAICIDQHNLAERSQQVSLMGSIYKRASRVIIWLGDLPDDLPLLPRALFFVILRLPTIIPSRHFHIFVLQHFRHSFKCALERTLRTSQPRWHERVWTVQEFVHARRAVYYHGPFQWDDLPDLMLQYDSGPRVVNTPYLKALFASFYSLTKLRDLGRLSLHQATVEISKRECKDPRDKIYGLLSILPRGIADGVVVDYTRTIEQVFMDATFAALRAEDTMSILTLVMVLEEVQQQTLSLPSWTVDFGSLAKREVGAQFGQAHHNGSLWHARFSKEGPRYSLNGSDLAVLGSRFDVVEDTVSVPLSEYTFQPSLSIYRATAMLRRLTPKLETTITTTRPKTAYNKSIWNSQQPNSSSAEIPIDLESHEHESNWRQQNDPIGFLGKVALVGNKLCEVAHQPIQSEMKSYARYLESVSDYATVLVSVAGLLAIAPGIVRKGDIIAMVAGAHGPVMLRPDYHRPGCFAFRGFVLLASYGHDVSLQDFWKRNGIDVERFTIC